MDLLADEPAEASPLSDAERLHQLLASVVGAADVADLARADQVVEGGQGLVKGRLAVPLMHLVQVDAVSAQPPQAGLTFADQVVARQPGVVGPLPIGMRALVATSTWSRRPSKTFPRISSDSPPE